MLGPGAAPGLVRWERVRLVLPAPGWCLSFPTSPPLPGLRPTSAQLSSHQQKLSGVFQGEARVAVTATSRQPGVEMTGQPRTLHARLPLPGGSWPPAPAPLLRSWGTAPASTGRATSSGRADLWRMLPSGPRRLPRCHVQMGTRGDGCRNVTWWGNTGSGAGGFSLYRGAFPCF